MRDCPPSYAHPPAVQLIRLMNFAPAAAPPPLAQAELLVVFFVFAVAKWAWPQSGIGGSRIPAPTPTWGKLKTAVLGIMEMEGQVANASSEMCVMLCLIPNPPAAAAPICTGQMGDEAAEQAIFSSQLTNLQADPSATLPRDRAGFHAGHKIRWSRQDCAWGFACECAISGQDSTAFARPAGRRGVTLTLLTSLPRPRSQLGGNVGLY
jgi:hypothetical protein